MITEGVSAECLYDGMPIIDKFSWIPKECDRSKVVAMSEGANNGVILNTGKGHTFEQKEIIQVLIISIDKPERLKRESILSYNAAVLNDNEVQLMDFVTRRSEKKFDCLFAC